MTQVAVASWRSFVRAELGTVLLRPVKVFGLVALASALWAIVAAVVEEPGLLHPAFPIGLWLGIAAAFGAMAGPISRLVAFTSKRLLVGFLVGLTLSPLVLLGAVITFLFQVWLVTGVEHWC